MEQVTQKDHASGEDEVQHANGGGDDENNDNDDDGVLLELLLGAPGDLAALGLQTLPPGGDLCAVDEDQDRKGDQDDRANTQIDVSADLLLLLLLGLLLVLGGGLLLGTGLGSLFSGSLGLGLVLRTGLGCTGSLGCAGGLGCGGGLLGGGCVLGEGGDRESGEEHQERQKSGQDSQLVALKHVHSSQSLRLFVKSVLAAEFAVLLELKSVRVVLLVLHCVVVSLLALSADQSDLDSYFISHDIGTSHKNYLQSHGSKTAVYLPLREPVPVLWRKFRAQQKSSSQR